MKIGDRIGAMVSASSEKKTVDFLGYGTYQGDEVPPSTGANSMTSVLSEAGADNPKLLLDGGAVVWGCECWWGPEAAIVKRIAAYQEAGFTINIVDIETLRHQPEPDA